MAIEQLDFDEHLEMYIELPGLDREVCLCVSDGLSAYEGEWTREYETNILDFINAFPVWQPLAVKAVLDYGKQTYGAEAGEEDVRLLNIFILFEQRDSPLFGLQYRTEYDVEHGCGLKIRAGSYEIVEVGGADVSFCS